MTDKKEKATVNNFNLAFDTDDPDQVKENFKDLATFIGDEPVVTMDAGPITFTDLRSQREAEKKSFEVKQMASEFPAMVRRIMNRPDIEQKDQALQDLANDFIAVATDVLAKEAMKEAKEELVSKEDHYKSVLEDDTLAKPEDFKGGCPFCEFGEKELMTDFDKCPYCWGVL